MNFVIGSGPAGIAAASALLDKGEAVTLLDAGGRLEPEIQAKVEAMSRRLPDAWDAAEIEELRGKLRYNAEGAPLKLVHGSDYLYRGTETHLPIDASGVDAYRSFAEGGLSVVWGGSVLPYTDKDLEGWPVDARALDPHYRAVLGITGLAAERDGLEKMYPLHIAPTAKLPASRQALRMLERMTANQDELARQGIHYGHARLAISPPQGAATSCVQCGLCLYGCPYGMVYSSRSTLEALRSKSKSLTYRPGFVVTRISESGATVRIESVSRETRKTEIFEGDRVFLGAGTYASTAVLLASLGAQDRTATLRQSDHFLLPLLMDKPPGDVSKEKLHTLSQLFLEITDEAISRHTVHLQLYTYNDFYSRMAKGRLGPLFPAFNPMLSPLFERIVLIKGYLHSEDSSSIEASLAKGDVSTPLRLRARKNAASPEKLRAVVKLLKKNGKALGAAPLGPGLGLRLGAPGSGAHVGGSFPMRSRPGSDSPDFGTDILSRPDGWKRVHVVDSTVFPTVPAPTITLSAMANAHRIATQALETKP